MFVCAIECCYWCRIRDDCCCCCWTSCRVEERVSLSNIFFPWQQEKRRRGNIRKVDGGGGDVAGEKIKRGKTEKCWIFLFVFHHWLMPATNLLLFFFSFWLLKVDCSPSSTLGSRRASIHPAPYCDCHFQTYLYRPVQLWNYIIPKVKIYISAVLLWSTSCNLRQTDRQHNNHQVKLYQTIWLSLRFEPRGTHLKFSSVWKSVCLWWGEKIKWILDVIQEQKSTPPDGSSCQMQILLQLLPMALCFFYLFW